MREENELSALPLLLRGRDFVRLQFPSPEVRNRVDDDPRNAASEVDNLMNKEAHQTRRNSWVVEPQIPLRPFKLEPVQLREICVGIEELRSVVRRSCEVRHRQSAVVTVVAKR